MKISILLPYKENFSPDYPGAVSIFIKDTTIISKYKKNITVYGSTNYKKKLLKNYINLPFNKEFLQSQSKIYVDNFLKQELTKSSDLIEIHNRPTYINHLYKQTKANFVLFYHNDPLNMSGSKLVKERISLLEKSSKIIFNSEWSKKRFTINLPEIYHKSDKL